MANRKPKPSIYKKRPKDDKKYICEKCANWKLMRKHERLYVQDGKCSFCGMKRFVSEAIEYSLADAFNYH